MTKKLTRAAILAALAATLVCAGAWAPRGALALAAMASLMGAATLIECGPGWAIGQFFVTAALGLLLAPDKTPALWYALALGPWPVIRHFIERLRGRVLRWALKLAVFLACMACLYFLFSAAFAGATPQLPWYVLLPGLCAVFILYDIAFSRLTGLYLRRIHRANR